MAVFCLWFPDIICVLLSAQLRLKETLGRSSDLSLEQLSPLRNCALWTPAALSSLVLSLLSNYFGEMAGLLDFPLPHRCPESLQVVGWGNRRAHPICFLSCRDNDSSWPDAQCLENHFFSVYLAQYFRRRQWHTTPVLLPGKSHGRRSLVGCHLWRCTESDTTEAT